MLFRSPHYLRVDHTSGCAPEKCGGKAQGILGMGRELKGTGKVKKINVAVLGLGDMGATHVKAAKDSPCIASVVGYEPDRERARQRGKKLGIKATNDLKSILDCTSSIIR